MKKKKNPGLIGTFGIFNFQFDKVEMMGSFPLTIEDLKEGLSINEGCSKRLVLLVLVFFSRPSFFLLSAFFLSFFTFM
jgi:hypothetical protein